MKLERVSKGKDVAAILLARGVSRLKAAKLVGVCEKTIYEYLKDPLFRQRVQELRNQFLDATVGQLLAMSSKAMARLEKLLESESEATALAAIREWKSGVIDLGNQYDLAKRIQELIENNSPIPPVGQAASSPASHD